MATETTRAQSIRNDTRDAFEGFFSRRTRDGLLVALPLIGALHAFIAAAYWFTAPHHQALGLSVFSILVTVAATAATVLIKRGERRIIGADGLATCVLLLALCNALIHLATAWSPLAVAAAAILVVASGMLSSRRTPLLVVSAAMQGWWALLAWADNWSPEWMQLQTALLAAVVTAWALQYSRRNTALQLFESEQRFALQAQRDPLTSLPLRSSLVDRIGECFSRESRNAERKFGVCVLNLDGFQQVNEKHGHSIGDLLLQTVAERLQQGCRRTDVVARLGGDEFVILLEETPSPEHADSGADRLCGIACQPVELDDIHLEISASYGVAWSGAGFASEDAMLSSAHKAMQAAKARAGFIHQAIESHKGVRQTHALTSPA